MLERLFSTAFGRAKEKKVSQPIEEEVNGGKYLEYFGQVAKVGVISLLVLLLALVGGSTNFSIQLQIIVDVFWIEKLFIIKNIFFIAGILFFSFGLPFVFIEFLLRVFVATSNIEKLFITLTYWSIVFNATVFPLIESFSLLEKIDIYSLTAGGGLFMDNPDFILPKLSLSVPPAKLPVSTAGFNAVNKFNTQYRIHEPRPFFNNESLLRGPDKISSFYSYTIYNKAQPVVNIDILAPVITPVEPLALPIDDKVPTAVFNETITSMQTEKVLVETSTQTEKALIETGTQTEFEQILLPHSHVIIDPISTTMNDCYLTLNHNHRTFYLQFEGVLKAYMRCHARVENAGRFEICVLCNPNQLRHLLILVQKVTVKSQFELTTAFDQVSFFDQFVQIYKTIDQLFATSSTVFLSKYKELCTANDKLTNREYLFLVKDYAAFQGKASRLLAADGPRILATINHFETVFKQYVDLNINNNSLNPRAIKENFYSIINNPETKEPLVSIIYHKFLSQDSKEFWGKDATKNVLRILADLKDKNSR